MYFRWGDKIKDIRDGLMGGFLVIFDEEGNMLIIFFFFEFMVVLNWQDREVGGNIYWGLMGGIDEVLYYYIYMMIVCYVKGINKVGGQIDIK